MDCGVPIFTGPRAMECYEIIVASRSPQKLKGLGA